jgi:acyl-coenzyme A synthetase/AMP-(fatty) acid ligase
MSKYQNLYLEAQQDSASFWAKQAENIDWFKKPTNILSQNEDNLYQWFEDGELNTCHLALDYHIENGRGPQTAIIYDSPVTNTIRKYTYLELRDEVARFAGILKNLGVTKGDAVVIYMPMIPEAAIAMLAVARLGAIHSVVFGGFAAHELAIRIDDAHPKVVLSASCGIEIEKIIPYKPLLDKALEEATFKPEKTIVFQREMCQAELQEGRDLDWNTLLKTATDMPDCVSVKSTDPLYILYTSGTTGKPKGIVRDNGGHAVAMRFSFEKIYNTKAGDIFWAASDVGWVVGHSYIVYAPLICGATTILFEGKPIKTPDAGTFWRVIEKHKVNTFFTAPTAFRAIRKEDGEGSLYQKYDTSSLKAIFVAGERCDVSTYQWLKDLTQLPVIDHWWQTESGWPMIANMLGVEELPIKPGSAGKTVSGYDIRILNEAGEEVGANQEGAVVIKLPLPPGCLPTLWQDSARFKESYLNAYPGYYLSGDGGYKDEEGYIYVMGRMDDVINVAGHRLSTGEMEEMVAKHASVAECAVIGIADELKGQVPIGLVVLKDGENISSNDLEAALVKTIREEIGPLACFKHSLLVKRLPKTRSGKILRKTLRKIADGEAFTIPSTIDDPAVLDEIKEELAARRIGLAFM